MEHIVFDILILIFLQVVALLKPSRSTVVKEPSMIFSMGNEGSF